VKEASSGGWLSRLAGPEPFLLFAVLGLFFPWVTAGDISSFGIEEGDGFPILALSAGSYLLARARVRWAWIPATLAAIVVVRDVMQVRAVPGVGVGVGLWMTVFGSVVASVLLLAREVRRVRDARNG